MSRRGWSSREPAEAGERTDGASGVSEPGLAPGVQNHPDQLLCQPYAAWSAVYEVGKANVIRLLGVLHGFSLSVSET